MKFFEFILIIAISALFITESFQKKSIELFFKFIQFSLTLAGFALTAGIFYYKNNKNKKVSNYLFKSSYLFLIAGIFFIITIATLSFAEIWNTEFGLNIDSLERMTPEEKAQFLKEYNQNRFSVGEVLALIVFFIIAVYSFAKGINGLFDTFEELSDKKNKDWYQFWLKKCKLCGEKFKNKKSLKMHRIKVHRKKQ